MRIYRLCLSVLILASSIFTGCGGGGGGGGGAAGTTATSVALGSLTGNIDADDDGTVVITYFLTSDVEKEVDVAVEFSADNGVNYTACTEDTSLVLNGQDNPTEGLIALETGPVSVQHYFAWDSDAPGNLPNQNLNWLLLRITVVGESSIQSTFLTLLNNGVDAGVPSLSGVTATAVPGVLNDIIEVSFNEPVDLSEAQDLDNFTIESPIGTSLSPPNGSSAVYNVFTAKTLITLAGAPATNLQYGDTLRVTVAAVHDISGNDISNGGDQEEDTTVVGDGASLPADQPELELAYVIGSNPPVAGDYLCLCFDEEMALDGNNTFDNNDVAFWTGGNTIGSSSPITVTLRDANTVQITLGTSPSITLNSSRINVPVANNVLSDLAGNVPYMPGVPTIGDYQVVIPFDQSAPIIDLMTLNSIPDILNGNGAAGGHLLVESTGFEIDLEYHDVGGAGVDLSTIEIFNDQDVTASGATVAANTNLVSYLQAGTINTQGANYTVPATLTFPNGMNTLRGRIKDNLANTSAQKTVSFEVASITTGQRPFETQSNASQVWNLIFDRDLYTISLSGVANISVTASQVANGTADFKEDLFLYGLSCNTPLAVTGTGLDSNVFMQNQVKAAVLSELSNTIFADCNIVFTDVNQGSIPGGNAQVSYSSFSHSQIAIGGDSDVSALGAAFIDKANANQDNDVLFNGSSPYNPGVHLGVFTTRCFIWEVNGSAFGTFRQTYDDFIPGRGTPVGTGANDLAILMDIAGTGGAVGGADAVRRDAILLAVTRLARFIAVIAAHEMGHSMGISVPNASPNGLYSNDPSNFPGSNQYHLSLTSFWDLFVVPSVNIMVPATNFWFTQAAGTRFCDLNKAYLEEKVFYRP